MARSTKTTSVVLAVTTSTARAVIPASTLNGLSIAYIGTGGAHINTGDATVNATLTNQWIIPNWPIVIARDPNDTNIAAIAESGGSGTLFVSPCSADECI